jgi:hypothetical protein
VKFSQHALLARTMFCREGPTVYFDWSHLCDAHRSLTEPEYQGRMHE